MSLPLFLLALAAQQADYPHAFPREGTTLLFDNPDFSVWEVNWWHGVRQPIHRHLYDMAGVYLRYGPIRVTSPDGEVVQPKPYEVPWAYFQLKGRTHKEEALDEAGAPEQLAIMIDLKHADAMPVLAPDRKAVAWRDGAELALENKRVRMWKYTWPTGQTAKPVAHRFDEVHVFFTGGMIRRTDAAGKSETVRVGFKDVRIVEKGKVEAEAASGTGPAPRGVVVEILQ